tara:strand:- start:912 stop:1775 length:864 start_codon:yes stop_codon:yes gene_type:complete
MLNLFDYKFDKYTSTGNDGIIEKIFNIVGIEGGVFVEFGAWDGIRGSNCRKLWEEGWSGVFIEAERDKYTSLVSNYRGEAHLPWPWNEDMYTLDRVTCIHSQVTAEEGSFDMLVRDHIPSSGIDFCSIDIDGLDLEVFEQFDEHLPKVVCIEGGQMLPPDHSRITPDVAQHNIQQSLSVMMRAFEKKGYKLLCTYQDSFFVKEEFFDKFDVSEDLTQQYLAGLLTHHRRLPWILHMVENVGLSNPIISMILSNTNFDQYGYQQRKVWAQKEAPLIQRTIGDLMEMAK